MFDGISEETMWQDTVDDDLTAIVIGPFALPLSRWHAGIWRKREEDEPPHFLILLSLPFCSSNLNELRCCELMRDSEYFFSRRG